jgi:penicillin amidase
MGKYEEYDYSKQAEVLRKHWAASNISLGSVNFPSFEFAVEGSGSNSWVLSGEHTKNGKGILASDPHLGSVIPTLFYCHESVLLTEDNKIKSRKFGAMPDGFPTMSIGISEAAAWGSTAAYIDNKDVYYETVRNESGRFQYKFKDQWRDFRERK